MLAQYFARTSRACGRRYVSCKADRLVASNSRGYVFVMQSSNGRRSMPASPSTSLTPPRVSSCQKPRLQLSSWRLSAVPSRWTRVALYTTDAKQPDYSSVKDDTHPSLFYHLFDDDELLQPVFALSFLEERPGSARSKTILGWLPALSPSESENEGNGLNDFKQNEDFLPILHKTIREGLLEDEIWTNGAIQAQSGWMHIFDQRKIPPLGRIPDPDDILASVRVEGGRMLIDTYEPMPSYRLCTADGVCQLTDTLVDRIRTTLKQIAEDEGQNH